MPVGWITFLLLLTFTHLVEAAGSVADTRQTLDKAIELQQKTQTQVDAWNQERDVLQARISNLKNRLRYLHFQQEKYASYSGKQEENIRTLEQKQANLQTLQMELEPYLLTLIQNLQDFVHSDLPFLADERQRRLAFLRESVEDYNLKTSEKFRRVLETLQVEAGYGNYPEVSVDVIDLDGQLTKVQILRLGRLAMFYLTLDGQKAGGYDRDKGRWLELPRASALEVKSAVQMVGKSRAMELVNLPIVQRSLSKTQSLSSTND